MPAGDRGTIIHDLLPALRNLMRGVGQQQGDSGPSEGQIRAKDAGYILLRYSTPEDRATLSRELLDWILEDLNTRALAGQYTAEQVVTGIGPPAAERLGQSYTSNEASITVAVEVSRLINAVATDAGKDAAIARLTTVTDEVAGTVANERISETARRMITRRETAAAATPERVGQVADYLRGQYLSLLFEAIKVLNRPAGTRYLLSIANNPNAPLERRKLVLVAVQGQVRPDDAATLLQIAQQAGSPTVRTDLELRGLAIDRLGESRNTSVLGDLWRLFDSVNGGEQNQEFQFRWKIGEAILKLGSAAIIPQFVQHLAAPRGGHGHRGTPPPAPFEGYTFREINGYAAAIGDFTPQPTAVMRGLLTHASPYVKTLALLYLAAKGDASDVPRIESLMADATELRGPGWAAETPPLQTVGAIAIRARNDLRRTLSMPPGPAVEAPVVRGAPAAGAGDAGTPAGGDGGVSASDAAAAAAPR
jgi:hypothetical protein